MRYTKLVFWILFIFQLCSIVPHAYLEGEYSPKELSLEVYSDGVVDLKYQVDVDPTLLTVNISLFGETYENLIARDQGGILLDYLLYDGYVRVDVLGSQSVDIEYSASDITSKASSLWILNLTIPINTNIQLPKRATIISLEPTPIGISILEESVSLTMPPGDTEIRYVLGVVGTKEHASALIDEAEGIIEEKRAEGVNVSEAEAALQLAKSVYDDGQYVQAEQFAEQAKNLALEAGIMALEAQTALQEAQLAIDTAQDAGRTSTLAEAREDFSQAQAYYEAGNYSAAIYYAGESENSAQTSKKPVANTTLYMISALGAVLIASIMYITRKNEEPPESDSILRVNFDRIFSQNPYLRLDEREVIKFIAQGKGVFVSQLRKRFEMPKSTAWRMIRRLENNDIIETDSIGRETFVKLHHRYV